MFVYDILWSKWDEERSPWGNNSWLYEMNGKYIYDPSNPAKHPAALITAASKQHMMNMARQKRSQTDKSIKTRANKHKSRQTWLGYEKYTTDHKQSWAKTNIGKQARLFSCLSLQTNLTFIRLCWFAVGVIFLSLQLLWILCKEVGS